MERDGRTDGTDETNRHTRFQWDPCGSRGQIPLACSAGCGDDAVCHLAVDRCNAEWKGVCTPDGWKGGAHQWASDWHAPEPGTNHQANPPADGTPAPRLWGAPQKARVKEGWLHQQSTVSGIGKETDRLQHLNCAFYCSVRCVGWHEELMILSSFILFVSLKLGR